MAETLATTHMADDRTPKGGAWSVRDKNAREMGSDRKVIARVHEILPGVTYSLFFNEKTAMSEAHARRFLKDASFEVFDANDELVPPLSEQQLSRDAPKIMDPDKVVALVNELTHQALMTRAHLLLTGKEPENFKVNAKTSRDTLIDFIVRRNTELAASASDDVDDDEMSADETARMFQ